MEMTKATSLAQDAVTGFHAQFNAGKFGDISSSVAAGFPAADRATFPELLGAIHRRLGNATESKSHGWQVRSINLRTIAMVQQETTFEHGKAIETFQWVVSDGKARLLGYKINSKELILK